MLTIAVGTQIGPYTIVRALHTGKGGMARVYIAKLAPGPEGQEQIVALKFAIPADRNVSGERAEFFKEALSNEVEILKRLRNPHIVRVFPIPWGSRNDPYFVKAANIESQPWFCAMEFIQGGSLQTVLEKHGKLEIKDAAEVARQIGLALEFSHSKDIAHLDVKPDNILFRQPFTPKGPIEAVLIDFGIATRVYKMGLDAGAVSYLPPERIRILRGELAPEQASDQRPADVYSMGLLLYRMLTGTLPFKGRDKSHISTAILKNAPTRPSEFNRHIPKPLEDLILYAMEKDPHRRPNIYAFNEQLNFVAPPRKPDPPDGGGDKKGDRKTRPVVLIVGATGALVVVLIGAGVVAENNIVKPAGISPTATATVSASPTGTPTRPVLTRTPAATVTPTVVASAVPTRAQLVTATLFPTFTATPTLLPLPTNTATPELSSTPTLQPTQTPSSGGGKQKSRSAVVNPAPPPSGGADGSGVGPGMRK
jgi:serine/threonine protein kinase